MISNLMANYFDTAAVILFVIGFATLLFNKNLIKKIIGFNIMDTAIYLFLAAQGFVEGRKAPRRCRTIRRSANKRLPHIPTVPAGDYHRQYGV